MQFNEHRFADSHEVMDGNVYEACKFHRCKMIYRGGGLPTINNCEFNECSWQFEDAAERTLLLMRLLYHGMGSAGPGLVESAIDLVRQANLPQPPPAGGSL